MNPHRKGKTGIANVHKNHDLQAHRIKIKATGIPLITAGPAHLVF
jgi:hypothetical protein